MQGFTKQTGREHPRAQPMCIESSKVFNSTLSDKCIRISEASGQVTDRCELQMSSCGDSVRVGEPSGRLSQCL